MALNDPEVIRAATSKPLKKVYLQVTYYYADTRANAPSSFVGEAFLVDEDAGGTYYSPSASASADIRWSDIIIPCKRGATVTVRPGWLWREVVRVERTPVALHVEPELPATAG